jgi:hypothetical protein
VILTDEIRIKKKTASWKERDVLTGRNKIHYVHLSFAALLVDNIMNVTELTL